MKPLCSICVLACVLFAVLVTAQVPQQRDGMFVYTIFTSCSGCAQGQVDGPSGRGTLFGATSAMISGVNTLLVCDDGSAGSTVRLVNSSGIVTIAGNLGKRGSTDGPAAQALFQSPSGIAQIDNTIYVADSLNNKIRSISSGVVSTFLSGLNHPLFLIPFMRSSGTYDLFVSDTGNSKILFAPATGSPNVISEFATGFQPGALQVSQKRNVMYAIVDSSLIYVLDMSNPTKRWLLGGSTIAGYQSALMLTADESELYYFANLGGNKYAIMSIEADVPESGAPTAQRRQILSWPTDDVKQLVSVDAHSFYVVGKQSVHLVRDSVMKPTPTETSTLTFSHTLTHTFSHTLTPIPPQASAPTSAPTTAPVDTQPPNPTSGPSPPTTPPISPTTTAVPSPSCRYAAAAFPTSAFPVSNISLMHQLYSWLMKDAGIAFGTNNFMAAFLPFGANDVPGSVNVSTWRNLTTRMSHDGTITIMDYCPPSSMTPVVAQDRLFRSPWSWTRRFLDSLRKDGAVLDDVCMIRCADDCERLSYNESLCMERKDGKPETCDNICKAAITSGVVLGAAGLTLVLMLLGSTSNRRAAFLMFPVI